jgi:hypothetical protein
MMAGNTEPADCLTVLGCRVSDVGFPAIAGVARCQTTHDPIARHFGHNGSGSDREAQPVAFDHGLHRAGESWGGIAVDQRDIGEDPEHGHGARHRPKRRAQNIDAVDFVRTGRADANPGSTAISAASQRPIAGLALLDRQELRIVEPITQRFREAAGVENHGGRNDGSGERSPPGLINTGHYSLAPAFEREIRHFCPQRSLVPRREWWCKRPRRHGARGKHAYLVRVSILASAFLRWRPVAGGARTAAFSAAIAFLFLIAASPSGAVDLFARHEVTVQFATPDGKPMANAEVRVFAPGDPNRTALTGRTDAAGKFVFDADRDGLWSAEAGSTDYIARVMIRVGGEAQSQSRLSPFVLVGFLAVLLAIAVWYRLLRARTRGPKA